MAIKDINSIVIDRCVYAFGEDADGGITWLCNQVADLTVSVDGEEVTKEDANGSIIARINRAKNCTVSFNSAIFDLNLIAAMNGTEKQIASADEKFIAPKQEIIEITKDNKEAVVLAQNVRNAGTLADPAYKIGVTTLTKDGSLKAKWTIGSATEAGVATYTASTKTLAFAEGDLAEGDKLCVTYEYETEAAVQVINSAEDFPVAAVSKFLIKCFDVCDQNTAIFMWLILPNAKMATNYELSFNLEDTIPVELNCAYDYCSDGKELYRLIIAE